MGTVEARRLEVLGAMGLYCESCHDRDCDKPRSILNCTDWPCCPSKLRQSTWWQHVIRLFNAKQVSPLHGWPRLHTAWVSDALIALEGEMSKKAADDIKRSSSMPAPPRGKFRGRRR
jgi:hypothetical protein